jgi:hypothetical protein
MIRSPHVWLSALWIGVLIHVDWHLGRPGHNHLSFGLAYHWLLGVITFAPIPWLLARRWPSVLKRASLVVIMLGVLLGQGVEPLGEVIHFHVGAEPFTNHFRWQVFAEFMTAGLLTYIVSASLALRQSRRAAG